MKLHKLAFPCTHCNQQTTIMNILASADGEMKVEAVCVICGVQFVFKTDVCLIIAGCVKADMVITPTIDDEPAGGDYVN